MNDKTETAQVLHENNCGIVVDPGNYIELIDSIIYFYDNPEIRNKMGKNGRKAVDELIKVAENIIYQTFII